MASTEDAQVAQQAQPLPLKVERAMPAFFTVVHRGADLADYWSRTYVPKVGGGRDVVLKLGYCRFLGCIDYEKCLLLACKLDWKSFTCEACARFQAALLEPSAWPPRVEGSPWWHPRSGRDEDGISLMLPGKDFREKLLEQREVKKVSGKKRRYHRSKLPKM